MRASIRRVSAIVFAILIVVVVRCTTDQATGTGGTGSETVIGRIVHGDGTPAGATEVSLHPYDFDPGSGRESVGSGSDTTDGEGRYEITVNAPEIDRYVLQAVNMKLRTGLIVQDIRLSVSRDSTVIPTAKLGGTGSIRVLLPDSVATDNGYAYIPGTTFRAALQNGSASIDSVPAGLIAQVYYNQGSGGSPLSLAESINVLEGIPAIVTTSGAANAAKLHLNTTAGGADVVADVYAFPLLVRLNSANFSFDGVETNGADLRFTKPDNTPLPFEIERWEAAARQAEIWVKIDTVYGNDDRQFIVLYWGTSTEAIPRDDAMVFDTADGFKGVWHLAEEAAETGTAGLYRDATGRSNGDDRISATGRTGIIGYGHAFDGIDDFIPVNSPVTDFIKGDLTIALWVNIPDSGGTVLSKLDTFPEWNRGETSLYFGDGTDTHVVPGVNGTRLSFVGFSNDYAIAEQPVSPGNWHYLVFTRKWNGNSTGVSRYFIDGREVPLSRDSLAVRSDETAGASIMIGRPNNNESYAFFNGLMDELEISAVARSADWVLLSYMNQRKENLLVQF